MKDDFDFFDEGFDEMFTEQKKQVGTTSSKFPISYCSKEGTYIFRLYPENYNGKPRMRRVIWSNQLNKFKRVLSTKEDRRISNLLEEYKEYSNSVTKLWSHNLKQEAIMMGYLISAPTDKNIQKNNTASLLVLNNKQMQALDAFFGSLEEEGVSLRNFLHPSKPSNAIKMTVKKVQNGKKTEVVVNVSATSSSDYELPPLAEALPDGVEFPGLDNLHVPHNAFLTDELFNEFKKYIEETCRKVKEFKENNVYNPKDQEQEKGYNVNQDQDDQDLIEVGKAALKK